MLVKKSVVALMLAIGLVVAPSVYAQDGSDLKIGYVNVQEVMTKAPQTKAAEEEFKKEFTKRQEELKALESEYLQLREKRQKEGLTMSDEQLKELEDNMLAKERKIRWNRSILDEDSKLRRQEIMQELRKKVYQTIAEIAQAEKFDLILIEGVLMSSSRVELTDRVLKKLKEQAK